MKAFAAEWSDKKHPKIDILFHNAGIANPDSRESYTSTGLDTIYATNFLGSFLQTNLLEPHLSPTARIILTSSGSARFGGFLPGFSLTAVPNAGEPGFEYGAFSVFGKVLSQNNNVQRYANSKLMQVVFAEMLQRRFDKVAAEKGDASRRLAFAFNPGLTASAVFDKMETPSFLSEPLFAMLKVTPLLRTDVDQGAATAVYLATSQDKKVTQAEAGRMWERMHPRVMQVDGLPEDFMERFWLRWENDAGVEWR